ncbi:MAG: hypothetical protein J6A83_09960 [Clostridia bacterium]|nr:hypothetical protein [Clostridia bacterium]
MSETEAVINEEMKNEETEELLGEDTRNDGGADMPQTAQAASEGIEGSDSETEALREEIRELRAALDAKEAEQSRILAQISEFSAVFRGKSLESVPAEVWESVSGGVPLAAAYALYEKKTEANRALTQSVNARNAERSSGAVGRESGSEYYSPAEVRKMSAAEVRKNYNTIIESMKKWN